MAPFLPACSADFAQKQAARTDEPPPPQETAAPVRVVHPEIAPAIPYPSSLYVESDVTLAARASGVIEQVLADRGQTVEKGQPLAVLETDLAGKELEIAEQTARLAVAEYDRLRPLNDQAIVSPQEFLEAEIARDQAISRRDLARATLDRCKVRAPFTGVIVERWATPGQRVQEDDGTPLFRLVGSEPLRARLHVPEERLGAIRIGSGATVRIAGRAAALPGRVVFVSPAIDPASGTAQIIVQLDGSDGLRPGAEAHVTLDTRSAAGGSLRLPREALRPGTVGAERDGGTSVMIVVDGRASPRAVRVVGSDGAAVLVTGPITTEDLVIVGGDVAAGDRVAPREAAL